MKEEQISLQDLWGNKKLSVCAQREADLLYTHFLHLCKHTSLFKRGSNTSMRWKKQQVPALYASPKHIFFCCFPFCEDAYS